MKVVHLPPASPCTTHVSSGSSAARMVLRSSAGTAPRSMASPWSLDSNSRAERDPGRCGQPAVLEWRACSAERRATSSRAEPPGCLPPRCDAARAIPRRADVRRRREGSWGPARRARRWPSRSSSHRRDGSGRPEWRITTGSAPSRPLKTGLRWPPASGASTASPAQVETGTDTRPRADDVVTALPDRWRSER